MSQTSILDTMQWYHLRLHTDKIDSSSMINQLKKMDLHTYVGGYEVEASRSHWQLAIQSNLPEKDFRALIKVSFNPERNAYSVSKKRKTLSKLATYLLKEDCCIYNGLPEDLIETMKKLVFKNSKKSKEQFYELDDKFLTTDMSWKDYIDYFGELKLAHRQTGRDQTMFARLDMLMQRRDPKYKQIRRDKQKTDFLNYFIGDNYK